MTQPKLSSPLAPRSLPPRARLTLWWALLAAYSLQDVVFTTIALRGISSVRELNPLAGLAFEHSVLVALALKIAALTIVLAIVRLLARTKHWPLVERILAAWCIVLLAINAWSSIQLLGGA